jgi:Zn-dependent membrane protease YugP
LPDNHAGKLGSKFKAKSKEQYSKMQLQNGMSGAEIAEKMLADNGIRDVRVISVAGQLTSLQSVNKTVNLRRYIQSKERRFGSCGST